MRLFRYEMKKLLVNKKRLFLLGILFAVYLTISLTSTMGSGELTKAEKEEYQQLAAQHSGSLDKQQFADSKAAYDKAVTRYGVGEGLNVQVSRDPQLMFDVQYAKFGLKVHEYWHGPQEQDKEDIKGIYPLEDKLNKLKQTDTYEYKYYNDRLEAERKVGEPVFENITFWNSYFVFFDGIFIMLMLLMPMAFFLSPLFTQEIRTEMDSIVLCSVKGRREIVTAKLLCAGLTSAIITIVYFIGGFVGPLIGYGNLDGAGAPVRCIAGLESMALDLTVGGAAAFASVWVVCANLVLSMALAFISCKMKTQSAAFGIGVTVLLAGTMISSFGGKLQEVLWPIAEFNFGTLSTFGAIWGGTKAYHIGGTPVSYGFVAIMVCVAIAAVAIGLTYLSQRRRSVA